MKRARTILTAALSLMLAACNVESDFLSQNKDLYTETITVSANRDGIDVNGPDGTRAVLTEDNTLKSVWEAGDQLTVWTGSDFSEDNMSEGGFTLNSGAGTNSATFMGTVRSTFVPDENTVLTAVIDNDDDMVDCSSGTTAALDFSEQESCTTSTVLHYDALWAQATYANRNFHFAHTMSFVKWTIKINGISAATTCDITLSASNMRNKATLNLAQGKLSSTNTGDITLKDVRIGADGKAVIYISLFPGYVSSKMSAVVTMADGKMTVGQLGTFSSFNFSANRLYTAAWTFDAPQAPEYTLTATSPATIAYNATSTGNYTVTSYATVGSTTMPAAWTVTKYEYSDDNGATWTDNGTTKPAWLTTLSLESGTGSTRSPYERGTATVDAASYFIDVKAEIDNRLKNNTAKNNYDLSQGGETANCYVISAPGTYKIPLIYGNARKANGSANSVCFNNTSPYVNYKGTAITNMWLKTDGTPASGSLVWKDVTTDIVTNLAVSSDKNFLTFTVPQSAIMQGNAVVAVKDNTGKTMWSWHLWFTEADALSLKPFHNASNQLQNFTRDELGFVYDTYWATSYDSPRRVRVTVTQKGSNKTAQFEIIQDPYSSYTFHSTKYQWGRKDAFPGPGSSTGAPTIAQGLVTYQTSILNPGTFYTSNVYTTWCSTDYYNAWAVGITTPGYADPASQNISTSEITKSVYDPCPVGFKMPGSNAFTGFTKTGEGTTTMSEVNGTRANKGWIFTDNTNGTSVFFPDTGNYYCHDCSFDTPINDNYIWCAVAKNNSNAYCLQLWSFVVFPTSSFRWGDGCTVRPVLSN